MIRMTSTTGARPGFTPLPLLLSADFPSGQDRLKRALCAGIPGEEQSGTCERREPTNAHRLLSRTERIHATVCTFSLKIYRDTYAHTVLYPFIALIIFSISDYFKLERVNKRLLMTIYGPFVSK